MKIIPFKNRKGEVVVYDAKQLYQYGINRISERDFGRQELKNRMLRFQQDSSLVDTVLDKLQAQGYIQDKRRALSILNQYGTKESLRKTTQRLRTLEIDSCAIEQAIEEYNEKNSEHTSSDSAAALLNKKFSSYLAKNPSGPIEQKEKDKMVRFLAYRGFSYSDIKEAIEQIISATNC